jgi:hypothetical protein
VTVRRAALIAVALVVLLPGCGGANGSGKPLTKEEYAAKADDICGKSNEQAHAIAKNLHNLSDLAKVADKTLPILDQAIKDIEKLEPPASEKALSDRWLTQVRALKDDLREIRDKAKSSNNQGLKAAVAKAAEHNSQSNALAAQLGMSICSKD